MYDPKLYPGRVCSYDPTIDREPVDQFGFVDIRKAFETGVIDGSASFTDESFNGVQDPDTLMPRPKDHFEAMRQADYVKSVLKSKRSVEKSVSAVETESKQVSSEPKITE